MMKKSNKKVLSRRGFSLVEVVIALAVITIITAATFPLIDSGTKLQAINSQKFETANITENAIECFRFDPSNFETNFNKCLVNEKKLQVITDNSLYLLDKGSYSVIFKIEDNTINIKICTDENANLNDSESINEYLGETPEYDYTYTKGGATS